MSDFIPGLELSQYFFQEAISPIMAKAFPNLAYSAARLGWGSDVIGFDTPMSMDHGWGPKMTIFLEEDDYAVSHEALHEHFKTHLPFSIRGFPTNFGEPLADGGVMSAKTDYPLHHMVTITTPRQFFENYLGVDIREPLTPIVWLTIPQQRLRTLRAGRIYHDGLQRLDNLRKKFHWYPHDLWLYLMASQWQRIDQDEPFIGRTGSVGDEIGSRLIASRLIRDIMHLCFLLEKEYVPYRKWFGTAFEQLKCGESFLTVFNEVLNSEHWKTRETQLSKAYILLAEKHNMAAITPRIEPDITTFYNRPFQVLHAARFGEALIAQITDPKISRLPPHLGNVDQITDNTDVLENLEHCKTLGRLYHQSQD